jgi:hypothetical protein
LLGALNSSSIYIEPKGGEENGAVSVHLGIERMVVLVTFKHRDKRRRTRALSSFLV